MPLGGDRLGISPGRSCLCPVVAHVLVALEEVELAGELLLAVQRKRRALVNPDGRHATRRRSTWGNRVAAGRHVVVAQVEAPQEVGLGREGPAVDRGVDVGPGLRPRAPVQRSTPAMSSWSGFGGRRRSRRNMTHWSRPSVEPAYGRPRAGPPCRDRCRWGAGRGSRSRHRRDAGPSMLPPLGGG